jgi:hypothetical protein
MRVPRLALSGLGVYPGDPCFDADRPDWLPYWVDDFTESDCKYQSDNILTASLTAVANPEVVASNVGGVIGQGAGTAASDVASGIATGVEAAASGAAAGVTNTLNVSGYVLIGVGLLTIFLLVKNS